jgi:glycosyltransferase involved in cell wall biosynthesis
VHYTQTKDERAQRVNPPDFEQSLPIPSAALVVIPAFNEGGGIAEVLRRTRSRFSAVVVVDDGSTDDTAAMARAEGVEVIRHPVNLGQGAALQTGFSWALEQGAQWVITLDSDGQHDPDDAVALLHLAHREGWDAALGSRFMGRTEDMPASRRALLRAALRFQNLTSGLKLTDVHNGLRVLSRAALQRIHLRQDRMAHASEIISQLAQSGLRVGEGPVTIRYTEYSMAKGQSALGALNILIDLFMARLGR